MAKDNDPLTPLANQFGDTLSRLGNSLAAAAGPLVSLANSLGSGLGDMAGKITDLILPGLGTLAETLVELPGKMLAATTPFVSALNPALLLTFNAQLANLNATIGTAFENVFNILAPVLDTVASLIQSTMDQLRPLVDTLTATLGGFFVDAVKNAVTQLQALMPVIEVLVSIFQSLMMVVELFNAIMRPLYDVLGLILKVALLPLNLAFQALNAVLAPILALFQTFSALVSGVVDALGSLITTFVEGLGLGALFKSLAATIKETILAIVAAVAKFLASLPFGWGEKILAAWEKRAGGGPHAIAAPKEVGFKGIEQITKDIAAAAFIAGGGTKEDQQVDLLKEIRDIIKSARDEAKGEKKWTPEEKERVGRWLNDHPEVRSAVESTGTMIPT